MHRFDGCFRLGLERPRIVGPVCGFVVDGDADVVFGVGQQSGTGVLQHVLSQFCSRPCGLVGALEEEGVFQVGCCRHLIGGGRPREGERRFGSRDGEVLTVGEVRLLGIGRRFLLGRNFGGEAGVPIAGLVTGAYLKAIRFARCEMGKRMGVDVCFEGPRT